MCIFVIFLLQTGNSTHPPKPLSSSPMLISVSYLGVIWAVSCFASERMHLIVALLASVVSADVVVDLGGLSISRSWGYHFSSSIIYSDTFNSARVSSGALQVFM